MSPALRRRGRLGRAAAALTAALALAATTACTVEPAAPSGPGDTGVIALLLPESKASRYESIDRPVFEQTVAEQCASCRVVYANAGQDAALQLQQAEAALSQGADVLVLDAVDAVAARGIVTAAVERGVHVVAYDRFISEVPLDFFVSYDAVEVGRLQGNALLAAVGDDADEDAGLLLVHGAPTDPNAAALEDGLRRSLRGSDLTVLAEYHTPDWSPDASQEWVEAQLTAHADDVVGVYAANDGTAGGAISAMRAAGLDPVPPVTGQDAELSAVQRIVAGDQHMTVFKSISEQARRAAEVAVRLRYGEQVHGTRSVEGIPAMLLQPVAVTRDDIAEVIVEQGVHTVEEICTPHYRAACAELGLVEEDA